ncbi:hypothetical protein DXG01_002463 [Tephrocybe rancida]|nr:hypothetical protein DXG01_002463 [Tephrocybe rancida]
MTSSDARRRQDRVIEEIERQSQQQFVPQYRLPRLQPSGSMPALPETSATLWPAVRPTENLCYTLPRLGSTLQQGIIKDATLLPLADEYRPPRLKPVPQTQTQTQTQKQKQKQKPATAPQLAHVNQTQSREPITPRQPQVPKVDDFRTTYHPSSDHPTKIEAFNVFGLHPSKPLPFNTKPWLPFHSELEFNFAKIMLDSALSNKHVDALIKIICLSQENQYLFEVETHQDLHNLWTSAAGLHGLAPFEPHNVKVPYLDTTRIHTLWSWPLMAWIQNALKDTYLANALQHDKYNGEEWIPFIMEPWTAKHMWCFQSCIPKGGKPLAITLYADKTRLSSFGGHQGYPIMANINNLPDTVEDEESENGKVEWVNFKKAVWHESFKILLKEVALYSKTGIEVKCGDGVFRRIYPFIFLLAADYEEQCNSLVEQS